MEGVYISPLMLEDGRSIYNCQDNYLPVRAAGTVGSHLYGAHAVLGQPRTVLFFSRAIGRRMNRERRRLAAACCSHLSERILGRSDVESLTRRHGRRLRRNCWQMNRKHSSLHYIITHYMHA